MKAQLNEVQVIYNRPFRQQAGKVAIVVVTAQEHAALHRGVQADMERIMQAAGVSTLKTAHIMIRRGERERQEKGLRELNKLLLDIREAKEKDDVTKWAGIATGYANAMQHFGLMSKEELSDVIGVIEQAGEQTINRIEAARRPFYARIFKKAVRA